jgi:MFS-type transporter involved in bile tolerance (Atg22 family)
MGFELRKLNVHRIVETEDEKTKLIYQGFEEVITEVEEIKENKEIVKKGKV